MPLGFFAQPGELVAWRSAHGNIAYGRIIQKIGCVQLRVQLASGTLLTLPVERVTHILPV